jgi:aminoglycoside 3-N-acetyltransferase
MPLRVACDCREEVNPLTGYRLRDIEAGLHAVGVGRGDTVYVISSLSRLPGLDGYEQTADTSTAFYGALRSALGDDGTIVVPTSSQNLCNTSIPFDPVTTPSFERGLFPEYVRALKGAKRSFHPFTSYTAIGSKAAYITENATRHAYGPGTPEARMIDMDAKFLALGVGPNIITTVHHVEHMMGVPYRYHKEFVHPVVRNAHTNEELFYQFVWYSDADVQASQNRRLFARLEGKLHIAHAALGRGRISCLSLSQFYELSVREFADDIYVWCDHLPTIRPYRE